MPCLHYEAGVPKVQGRNSYPAPGEIFAAGQVRALPALRAFGNYLVLLIFPYR